MGQHIENRGLVIMYKVLVLPLLHFFLRFSQCVYSVFHWLPLVKCSRCAVLPTLEKISVNHNWVRKKNSLLVVFLRFQKTTTCMVGVCACVRVCWCVVCVFK